MSAERSYHMHLNGLRGLAAMMVLVGHGSHGLGTYLAHRSTVLPLWAAVNACGTYGVELFFLLSGYVIPMSIERYDARTFYRLRFARIYPLFAVITLAFFVVNKILHVQPDRMSSPLDLLANLLGLSLILKLPVIAPNAWTLIHEMWFYILGFPLLKNFFFDGYKILKLLAIITMVTYLTFFPVTVYFLIGNLFYVLRARKITLSFLGNASFALAAVVMLVLSSRYFQDAGLIRGGLLPEVVLFIATIIFFWGVVVKAPVFGWLATRPLAYLALISYSLYLTHPYPYFILKRAIFDALIGTIPDGIFALFFYSVTIALSVAVAHLSWLTIEQNFYRRIEPKQGSLTGVTRPRGQI